ncbi:MAG: PIN domain-containing protein [Candidatus Desantisbacteria bacterium]
MILIDTNIIVCAHNADSPHYQRATQLMKDALNLHFSSCIAHQNLLEFFSVITNPRQVELSLSSEVAFSVIELYLQSANIQKISPSKDTLSKAIPKAKKQNLSKAEIFDGYLVATMQENNVSTIYTENLSHFKKYPEVEAINPFADLK